MMEMISVLAILLYDFTIQLKIEDEKNIVFEETITSHCNNLYMMISLRK